MKDRKELFLPITGFSGYEVGSKGSVRSCKDSRGRITEVWRMRTLVPDKSGYLTLVLRKNGKSFCCKVATLVLTAFVGPRPPGMEVCHNDGVRTNNEMWNLRWDTPKNNRADKQQHGTANKGERNGSAKLTEKQVLLIRRLYETGDWTCEALSKRYGVSLHPVYMIVTRKRWTHI
jgi:hypothetical protein